MKWRGIAVLVIKHIHAAFSIFCDASSRRVRRVELEQWLWPEFPLRQCRVNRLADRRVVNVDEAANVARIIFNNLCMDFEDVHAVTLKAVLIECST